MIAGVGGPSPHSGDAWWAWSWQGQCLLWGRPAEPLPLLMGAVAEDKVPGLLVHACHAEACTTFLLVVVRGKSWEARLCLCQESSGCPLGAWGSRSTGPAEVVESEAWPCHCRGRHSGLVGPTAQGCWAGHWRALVHSAWPATPPSRVPGVGQVASARLV